jgi:hypothetical protein
MILIYRKSTKGEASRPNTEIIHHKGEAIRSYQQGDETYICNDKKHK